MQNVKIPVTIDPIRAAAKKLDYEGIISRADFTRFADMVDSIENDIEVRVSFYEDLSGLHVFEGTARTSVVMTCQRCLERMNISLEAKFRYSPDEKLLRQLELEDEFDCAELNSFGEVHLYDIIEDELILSLPLIAKHPEEECPAAGRIGTVGGDDMEQEGGNFPFRALGDLIKSKNN